MKKYILIPIVIISLVLVSSVLNASSAIPTKQIQEGFDNIKANLEKLKPNEAALLVEGDDIQISVKRFIFYKSSLELINSLQSEEEKKLHLSDNEIIDVLVAEDLAVQYAKGLGLTASEQEIEDVIELERKNLKQNNDPDNDLVREFMANRIRITGLTEDEFWKSDEAKKNYEKSILLGKLVTKLIEDGTIKDMNEFNIFKKELLESKKKRLQINWSVLQN